MTTIAAGRGRLSMALALVSTAFTLHAASARAADGPSYRVRRGDIRVVCPLTVGGVFETKTTSIAGTVGVEAGSPAVLSGELRVDLATLDTGIGLRNTHLREKYLEVGRGAEFASAILSAVRLEKAGGSTFRGHTPFTGMLLLHGTRRPVAGQAEIQSEGNGVRVVASFPVRIDDYGIAPPRYLGVGVKNEVQVKISLVATPEPAVTAETRR
jgi:polyisoprenoid-binding protein YceI